MSHSKDWCFIKLPLAPRHQSIGQEKGLCYPVWVRLPPAFHARELSDIIAKSLEYQVFKNTQSLFVRSLQRRMFQHKLLHSFLLGYRTLLLFGHWLFPRVGAIWVRTWKSLSSSSLCSAGTCLKPWRGMQCYEEEECPPLSCLVVGTSLPPCPHLKSSSSGKPLPIWHRCCCRRHWENSLKLPQLTPF